VYIAITSLTPDQSLIEALRTLAKDGRVLVAAVPETADVPKELFGLARVVTADSRDRSGLLKAALRFIGCDAQPLDTVVTLDHGLASGAAAAEAFISSCENAEGLTVGCFEDGKKKRAGVRLSRWFLKTVSGIKLSDPFSGLRAYQASLIPELLKLKGSGYEFESHALMLAVKKGMRIGEVSLPGASPAPPPDFGLFRAARPIFGVLTAFILSSLSSFAIDYAAFLTFSALLKLIPSVYEADSRFLLPVFGTAADVHVIALVLARCVSSFCNFMFNRRLVFRTGGRGAIIRYYALLIVMLLANSGLFTLITGPNGLPAWLAQPVVQVLLYPLNFILQRKWVFPERRSDK
jgi:putative flippase GtrA